MLRNTISLESISCGRPPTCPIYLDGRCSGENDVTGMFSKFADPGYRQLYKMCTELKQRFVCEKSERESERERERGLREREKERERERSERDTSMYNVLS